MAFLGKEYKFVSQENFEEYILSIGFPEEAASKLLEFQPSVKIELDDDTYTLHSIHPDHSSEVSFKSGDEIEDTIMETITSKSTYTVDGDTVTKVQEFEDGNSLTTVKEFTDDSMVETFTSSKWDGEAKRVYEASD